MPSNERASHAGFFERKKIFNSTFSNDMAQDVLRDITDAISLGRESTISALLAQSMKKFRRNPHQSKDTLRLGLIQLEKQHANEAHSFITQSRDIVLARMQHLAEEFKLNRERIAKEFSFQIIYSDILTTQANLEMAHRRTSIERTSDYRNGKAMAESALIKLIRSAEHAVSLCDRNYSAQLFFEQMTKQLKLTKQITDAHFAEAISAITRAEILRLEITKFGR